MSLNETCLCFKRSSSHNTVFFILAVYSGAMVLGSLCFSVSHLPLGLVNLAHSFRQRIEFREENTQVSIITILFWDEYAGARKSNSYTWIAKLRGCQAGAAGSWLLPLGRRCIFNQKNKAGPK